MISIPGSLSFVMSSAPAKKSAGDARCASHDKSHKISTQIRIRKRSSYVERNEKERKKKKTFWSEKQKPQSDVLGLHWRPH